MNTRTALTLRIASAAVAVALSCLVIVAGVFAIKALASMAEPEPQPSPTVTYVIPEPVPACADAAQWYYEHYVALVAESRALAAGEREASPEWLTERIEPAMAGEPEAFDQLQACREATQR